MEDMLNLLPRKYPKKTKHFQKLIGFHRAFWGHQQVRTLSSLLPRLSSHFNCLHNNIREETHDSTLIGNPDRLSHSVHGISHIVR